MKSYNTSYPKWFFGSLVGIFFSVSACNYYQSKVEDQPVLAPSTPGEPGKPGEPQIPPDTFRWVSKNILMPKCSECHGKDPNKMGADMNFMDYGNVMDSGAIEKGSPDDSKL